MKPIYKPKGRAAEYCELAVNIYNGCPHGCTYCFARKMSERFHPGCDFSKATPRLGIVEAVKEQLVSGAFAGKTIELCFTCDPYPIGRDTSATREIIKAIKAAGAHVQILTKGNEAARDFDLLDSEDLFGITISTIFDVEKYEPNAAPIPKRYDQLFAASKKGIQTWISVEPVLDPEAVAKFLKSLGCCYKSYGRPLLKIGKLNYDEAAKLIDWGSFGRRAKNICEHYGMKYYIKADLLAEMEKSH